MRTGWYLINKHCTVPLKKSNTQVETTQKKSHEGRLHVWHVAGELFRHRKTYIKATSSILQNNSAGNAKPQTTTFLANFRHLQPDNELLKRDYGTCETEFTTPISRLEFRNCLLLVIVKRCYYITLFHGGIQLKIT